MVRSLWPPGPRVPFAYPAGETRALLRSCRHLEQAMTECGPGTQEVTSSLAQKGERRPWVGNSRVQEALQWTSRKSARMPARDAKDTAALFVRDRDTQGGSCLGISRETGPGMEGLGQDEVSASVPQVQLCPVRQWVCRAPWDLQHRGRIPRTHGTPLPACSPCTGELRCVLKDKGQTLVPG